MEITNVQRRIPYATLTRGGKTETGEQVVTTMVYVLEEEAAFWKEAADNYECEGSLRAAKDLSFIASMMRRHELGLASATFFGRTRQHPLEETPRKRLNGYVNDYMQLFDRDFNGRSTPRR